MFDQLDGTPVRKVFDSNGNQVKSGADLDVDQLYICTDGRVPYFGASPRRSGSRPRPSAGAVARRSSANLNPADVRARYIAFTRANGGPVVNVLIQPRHLRSHQALLAALSQQVDRLAVRQVFDATGQEVFAVGDLKEDQVYTCSDRGPPAKDTAAQTGTERRRSHPTAMATELVPNKVITVFGNGMIDSAGHRVVLNKRTAANYDRLLDLVGRLIPLQGGVRKLYTLPDCKLVKGLPLPSKTTDFIAVGTIGLDRKHLPRLAPTVYRHDATHSHNGSEADVGRRTKRAMKTRGKRLPPINGAQNSERGALPRGNPLPAVHVTQEGAGQSTGGYSGEEKAQAVMAAADVAEAAKSSERERQRQKHQERYITRQKARQQNRDNKVERVAMAAEHVGDRIDEERARQQRNLKARIEKRGAGMKAVDNKAADHRGGAATAGAAAAAKAPAQPTTRTMSEAEAAAKIQSAWRGHKGKRPPRKSRGKNNADKQTVPKADHDPPSSKALLKVKRIPTPDLSFSKEEEQLVKVHAATQIQKTFRGHQTRRKVGVKKTLKAPGRKGVAMQAAATGPGGREQETRDERRMRRKKEKEGKKLRKSVNRGDARGADGADPPVAKLEREGSRFSTRGIEDKSVVESQYEIGRKIGDGNFAVVRECVRKSDGVKMALKIIDKSKTVGAKETKMIENEVKSMRAIKHPHCVELFDVIDTKDEIYLVMELVPGGDLFDRIVDHGKFDEIGAAIVIKNMTTALDHMHSQNIIHRDLKPENLLVTTEANGRDTVKLADFGLSMRVKDPLHTICGTPTYVAPEIISELPAGYSFPVDMWATGVIAYIILCGFPPFASATKSQKDLFRKIRAGKFTFPDPYWRNVSDSAKDLIRKLLVVDPESRYTAKQVLAHPWIQQHTEAIELE